MYGSKGSKSLLTGTRDKRADIHTEKGEKRLSGAIHEDGGAALSTG